MIISWFQRRKLLKEVRKTLYRIPYTICENCHRVIGGYAPKGTLVESEECPKCGCVKLVVQHKKEK